jgi:hypothetical protein
MRNILSLFLVLIFSSAQAQELNCTVTVNAQKLTNVNQSVFKTLETALNEFVNRTQWTSQTFKQNEKINCSMYITISSNNSDQFVATIQVQSSRPIHNSSYASPILNFNDKDFSFKYAEFESLNYNPTAFESNLVSVISFYSYVILGMDADSFVAESGNTYFETALNISNVAQQSGYKGWTQADGNQSRYFLINDLLSPTFREVRQTMYDYHNGLDLMNQDLKASKEKIKKSLLNLSKLNATRPNAFLMRVFFDAKSDEIVSIFSGGPTISITDLVDNLNRISPLNSSKWSSIKY